MSLGSPAIMTFRPKKKAKINTSHPPKIANGEYAEVLSVPLFHGDLVVMHGTGIHRLYDVRRTNSLAHPGLSGLTKAWYSIKSTLKEVGVSP